MGEMLTREQIDDIERDTLDREHQEDSTTIETLCHMARAYINDGAARHADHEEIERCHDVIREGSELLATARRELAETEARLSAAVLGREHYRVEAEQSRRELGEVRAAAKALVDAADACEREAENHPSSRSSAPLVRYVASMSKLRETLKGTDHG